MQKQSIREAALPVTIKSLISLPSIVEVIGPNGDIAGSPVVDGGLAHARRIGQPANADPGAEDQGQDGTTEHPATVTEGDEEA